MIIKFTFALLVLFTILNTSESLNRFIRGRKFFHEKKQNKIFKLENNITDLYYDQELDHFKESDKRTWKQVYFDYLINIQI